MLGAAHHRSRLQSIALLACVGAFVMACRASEPSNRPVDLCRKSCEAKASRHCSSDECTRGCEFILDRLVEREGENVIACVAKGPRRCTDVVWADCAARIGVHSDGGPPAPPPPSSPEDE